MYSLFADTDNVVCTVLHLATLPFSHARHLYVLGEHLDMTLPGRQQSRTGLGNENRKENRHLLSDYVSVPVFKRQDYACLYDATLRRCAAFALRNL